jgi:DNA-binding Xre family transcriptional regulator
MVIGAIDSTAYFWWGETQLALGLPPSTLHRLERGDQSITLRGLQQIMKRLKCGLSDIFGD